MWASDTARARSRSSRAEAGVPPVRLTLAVRTHILADAATLATFRVLRKPPNDSSWQQMLDEAHLAQTHFARAGWLEDPRSYHVDPPSLGDFRLRRARAAGLPVERLTFPSSWTPPRAVPGRERWLSYEANRTACATVLRHSGAPRPWIVCVHGTGMGRDADLRSFHARHLFTDLGCNVVLPILPLHGRRREKLGSAQFPSIDPLDNVHGLAQATHDVRQIIRWIRTQSQDAIGVQGVSVGGYVAALVASLEAPLDCVVAIIPVTDFPALFRSQTPPEMLVRLAPMLEPATALHTVVSPLRLTTRTPAARLFIAAGLVDRLVDPVEQVAPLWHHWQEPNIYWYPGGHIGYVVRRDVRWFVDAAFISRGVFHRETVRVGE
jgi:pimeloyl-ACP methyl ester carboxylesterase